jgi:hypothetical protein
MRVSTLRSEAAANKPALNGTVSANNVQMSDKDIALPVQIPSVTLSVGFDLTPKLPSDAVVQWRPGTH